MKLSKWLGDWWPRGRPIKKVDRRRISRQVEPLEPRLVLTNSPTADWFGTVHPVELNGGLLHGASGIGSVPNGDAIVGTWIDGV